ncbi:hypothetical protein QQ054_15915 [Oscillatoria amoena NRMC-F 0135]|nr:hypothetical protein [Oscillatoria amoena NRMC-F 0135]
MRFVNPIFIFSAVLIMALPAMAQPGEHIVLSGGPALPSWEKTKNPPHDRVWDNFIFTGQLRIEQLQKEIPPGDIITWIIHRPGYVRRGQEQGVDYIARIEEAAKRWGVNLVWFDKQGFDGNELIDYINRGQDRSRIKIKSFDYFGHSNKKNFLFDYSSDLDGVSTAWLHIVDLKKIDRTAFDPTGRAWSYGCHSGDGFIQAWYQATGMRMWGTKEKTNYAARGWPVPSRQGYWE